MQNCLLGVLMHGHNSASNCAALCVMVTRAHAVLEKAHGLMKRIHIIVTCNGKYTEKPIQSLDVPLLL